MTIISSRNEWDKLKTIVVGSAANANWPMTDPVFAREASTSAWTKTPAPAGPVAQWIIDQANTELDILSETLVRQGVTVHRPMPMDFVKAQGMYNYCPRDRLLIGGDTVVDCNMMYPCRNQEIVNYQRFINNPRTMLTMPRNEGMTLDAANICRLGDTWLFLESASGNRAAYEWLSEQFPKINIEFVNFYSGTHIDSTVTPLREGLVLLNASRINEDNCPRAFKDWEKIYIRQDQIVAQDFHQYPYASDWIGMNMLSIDPTTVICDRKQINIITILERKKFTVIPLELSHARTLGGGFHCVTLDLWREHYD